MAKLIDSRRGQGEVMTNSSRFFKGVKEAFLKCNLMDGDASDCGPDSVCPSLCLCTGNAIRYSRQKLKSVPKHIQTTTSELYLDINDIAIIIIYLKMNLIV